ncbi:MAG TPA: hypothetical protein VJJ22_01015 [Candidatus Paceibacterota bacterium]
MKYVFYALTILILTIGFASSTRAVTDELNVYLNVTNSTCTVNCGGGGGGGGGGGTPLKISNIAVIPTMNTAVITWLTNLSAISTISWGKTTVYELGSSAETSGATSHAITLTSLEPGTTYYFKIEAYETGNTSNKAVSLNNIFVTLSVLDEPPPTPTNLKAIYAPALKAISLTWKNPTVTDFDIVRIVRSTTFFPQSPTDGQIIYEGDAEDFDDYDVTVGPLYYYSHFARDVGGNWSSPAVASARVPVIVKPPPDLEPPITATTTPPTIFDNFPPATSTPPGLENLAFIVRQNDKEQKFVNGTRIILKNNSPTEIFTSYENLPEVLKTIGISMRHPKDKSKIFSFLLRVDEGKLRYTATIGPLLDLGEYEVSIYVFDYTNSRLVKLDGVLVVEGEVTYFPRLNSGGLFTLAGLIGLPVILLQTLILTTKVTSFYDLYLLILRFGGVLLGILGIRRKHKPWGTVYDSVTKRPLDPAYVQVREISTDGKSKSVADAITDLDGRYGFLIPGGVYTLEAGKTNYTFPSVVLSGKHTDELYDNLYYGEELVTSQGELITRNIPLDPVGFDWNEFVKNKQALFRLYSRKEKVKAFIFDSLYLLGFLFTLLATIISPSVFNFILLGIYVVVFIFQTYWHSIWKAITVKDTDNEPYSFAIVRVFLSNLNQEVKRVVTDGFGRFYLLVSPGTYYITVDAKVGDGSYRRVYRSSSMHLSKGVLSGDIIIGANEATESKVRLFSRS